MQVPLPVAQPVQNVAAAGSSSASYPHGMSYPGHQQQPNVIYQQQQPPQVSSCNRRRMYGYGGYGYGYDPFLGGMLGFCWRAYSLQMQCSTEAGTHDQEGRQRFV